MTVPPQRSLRRTHFDASLRPFLVIWEATRACDLACRHCRAEAVADRHPRELSTEEAARLMAEVADFGPPRPLLVLTGGDPFKRPDLFELVEQAVAAGLPVAVSPSGTPTLTPANLRRLREAGTVALSLSIDGSTPQLHDEFRGVPGVFRWTMGAWRVARELGLRVQVNTTLTRHNLLDLPDLLRLVWTEGAMTWSVFSLVPTGRGAALPQLTSAEFEDVLHFLYEADRVVSVKTTEAPHFRRVVLQRRVLEERGLNARSVLSLGPLYRRLRKRARAMLPDAPWATGRLRRVPLDVNAGRGFVFVSHLGTVHPSGFLPLAAGNVRRRSLRDIYCSSPLFEALRDPERLGGRCGRCEFRSVCGGSRSRAFGITGDPLAEEPLCSYEPGSFPFPQDLRSLLTGAPVGAQVSKVEGPSGSGDPRHRAVRPIP